MGPTSSKAKSNSSHKAETCQPCPPPVEAPMMTVVNRLELSPGQCLDNGLCAKRSCDCATKREANGANRNGNNNGGDCTTGFHETMTWRPPDWHRAQLPPRDKLAEATRKAQEACSGFADCPVLLVTTFEPRDSSFFKGFYSC